MRREDRTSISSHPLADLGWKLLIGLRHRLLLMSSSSFVRAAKGRSFVPARRTSIASRAGAVKAGRRAWLAVGANIARLRRVIYLDQEIVVVLRFRLQAFIVLQGHTEGLQLIGYFQ